MMDDKLKKSLVYDPETGVIYRLPGPYVPERRATLNTLHPNGHLYGTFHRVTFKAHRVAWFLAYGKWPDGEIDHINGDRSDNRLSNLRDVSHTENTRNMKRRSDNLSGITGVSYQKSIKRWVVRIGKKYVGCYVDKRDAVAARKKAEAEHGYHKNHGR